MMSQPLGERQETDMYRDEIPDPEFFKVFVVVVDGTVKIILTQKTNPRWRKTHDGVMSNMTRPL